MFCTECGKPLVPGAPRCSNCQAAIEPEPGYVAAPAATTSEPPPPPPQAAIPEEAPAAVSTGSGRPLESIGFGDWRVLEKAVASSRGIIPLDQVSCCTYDAEPRNIRNIIIAGAILLAGLYTLTQSFGAGLVLSLIGGAFLWLALQEKRTFRLYATSGYFFEGRSTEMDMSGGRIREFEAFNAALIEHRHSYLTSIAR